MVTGLLLCRSLLIEDRRALIIGMAKDSGAVFRCLCGHPLRICPLNGDGSPHQRSPKHPQPIFKINVFAREPLSHVLNQGVGHGLFAFVE